MKYFLICLFILVTAILSATLGANNDQMVNFNYLISQGKYQLSVLLAALFFFGFTLGWIILGLYYVRARISLLRTERKLKNLALQLEQIENKS